MQNLSSNLLPMESIHNVIGRWWGLATDCKAYERSEFHFFCSFMVTYILILFKEGYGHFSGNEVYSEPQEK